MAPSLWTSCLLFFGLAILVTPSWSHQRADTPDKNVEAVVYVRREPGSGMCSLSVNGFRRQQAARKPQVFRFISLWRYDPDTSRWLKERWNGPNSINIRAHLSASEQTLVALPKKVGLFWVEWSEDDRQASSLAVSGPVLCNDLLIGEPPSGTIVACVPSASSAVARFVPDPRTHRGN